jgi:hypothetical protein
MTEQPAEFDEPTPDEASPDEASAVEHAERPATTGVPAVDQVLADVDRLDDLPLDDHLGAFERAHESLRSALDAQPDEGTGERSGESA